MTEPRGKLLTAANMLQEVMDGVYYSYDHEDGRTGHAEINVSRLDNVLRYLKEG